MFEELDEVSASEIKSSENNMSDIQAKSFKKIRKIRKKINKKNPLKKSLDLKAKNLLELTHDKASLGPTKETAAKLRQDPLVRFKNANILNDQQIWAFQRIRRAVVLITDGTQVRTSRFNGVVVQTSRQAVHIESDYEIKIKNQYSCWIDCMTATQYQAGPVLDIIIDEMSLNAADRKWGKRKGWAKSHLQSSLDLYGVFPTSHNRNK